MDAILLRREIELCYKVEEMLRKSKKKTFFMFKCCEFECNFERTFLILKLSSGKFSYKNLSYKMILIVQKFITDDRYAELSDCKKTLKYK